MIEVKKPVVRKTAVVVRDGPGPARQLVVTVHPEFLTLRRLGTRQEEIVHFEGAYFGAIKARVWRDKMVKAQARAERKRLNAPLGVANEAAAAFVSCLWQEDAWRSALGRRKARHSFAQHRPHRHAGHFLHAAGVARAEGQLRDVLFAQSRTRLGMVP